MVGPKTAPPAEEGCTDLCLGNDSINNVDTMSINDATHALRTECLAAVTGRLSTSRSEREPPEIPRSSSFAFPPRMTRRTAAATGTAQNGKVGGLSSKFTNITRVRVSCPCLSLHHDKTTTEHSSSAGAASSGPSADRKEAEEHAVNLLSRPLVMVICGGDDTKGDHSQENTPMGDANGVSPTKTSPTTSRTTTTTAGTLLENIYESFAILVASRLHVYTSFLQLQASRLLSKKRHKRLRLSTAAGSKQQKKIATPTEVAAFRDQLHRILAIGAQIETLAVTTRFVLEENGTAIALVDGAVSVALLRFQVTIDTAIPLPSGRKEIVSVDFDTFGKMTGKNGYRADSGCCGCVCAPCFANCSFNANVSRNRFSHTCVR